MKGAERKNAMADIGLRSWGTRRPVRLYLDNVSNAPKTLVVTETCSWHRRYDPIVKFGVVRPDATAAWLTI